MKIGITNFEILRLGEKGLVGEQFKCIDKGNCREEPKYSFKVEIIRRNTSLKY